MPNDSSTTPSPDAYAASSAGLQPHTTEPRAMTSDRMTTPEGTLQPRSSQSYVYAIGSVEPRFPSESLAKECAQAISRIDTSGLTERAAMRKLLERREYRYISRHMCWVFSIERIPTYLLVARDPFDLELLVDALKADTQLADLDVVIGLQGPPAPAESCGGLRLPTVLFDQLYSFARDDLLSAIPVPEGLDERQRKNFDAAAAELFERIMQLTDNVGSSDGHRALNFLAMRYPAIYAQAADASWNERGLSEVEVRPSRLSSNSQILDVIFRYTHRRTDVTDMFFVRVDVTGEFPFLVTKLQPYFDR